MSSAKALLAAAGLLKPSTSTATEHAAKLPETSTATEHATSSSQPDTAASKPQASASLSYFSLGDSDLEKIVALLMWMTQNSHPNVPIDDIHHAALEAILKHSEAGTRGRPCLLHEASIAKLSELIDIMMLTKDGKPKDPNETLVFMRRVATIREEVRGTSSDNATERFELDHDSVSLCYKLFGRTMLQHDLLPHQKKNKQYCLRWQYDNDTHLTTKQRSWTDNMLRKFLGDKKVATLIWQHGLPSMADPPLYRRGQKPDIGMLQSSLNECLQWYCSLANGIMAHQTQKGFAEHHLASSLDEQQRERQQRRREELQKVKDALQTGAALAKQRDCGKRSYEEMDGAEQKMLEEYETGAAKKAKEDLTLPKLQPFRCELPFNKVGEQCTVEQGASCSSIKLESALQAATGTAAEPCAKRRKRVLLQALLQNTKRRKASTATGCKHAAKRRKKSIDTEHAMSSSQPDTAASTKVQLRPRRKSKSEEVEAASAATEHAAKRRKHARRRRTTSTATECKHAAKRRKTRTATEHAASSSQPDTAASTKVQRSSWKKVQLLARSRKKVQLLARRSKTDEVEAAKAAAKAMQQKAEAATAAADKAMVETVALQKHAAEKDEAARIAVENADAAKRVALQAAAQQAVDQAEIPTPSGDTDSELEHFCDSDTDSETATVVRKCNRLASGG